MNILALTSSRADYGILSSLLKKLESSDNFNLKIVAFGTHTSKMYGFTVSEIIDDGFHDIEQLETVSDSNMPRDISQSMGTTCIKLASIWERYAEWIDVAICLGDRYEMFAAVSSSVPFNVNIAHLHGGETTLGAIDNKFRHCITSMSSLHFTATETFKEKVIQITGSSDFVYDVGALSIDKIVEIERYDVQSFRNYYGVDLSIPTILVTLHPETANIDKVEETTDIFIETLEELSHRFQMLVTMPNADTNGNKIRKKLLDCASKNKKVICKENLGYRGYFSAMRLCKMLLGNTSSGIIEAASFEKYVINIGNRQQGRAASENIIHTDFEKNEIISAVDYIERNGYKYKGTNIYYKENVANKIIEILEMTHTKSNIK